MPTDTHKAPLRIGLLGASKIGIHAVIKPARHRQDVQVTAVAARDQARASDYAKKYAIANAMSDYQTLLRDDDVDLVYIGLPQSEHCEWTIRALEAGKDVLCEKPFALNAEQAQRMVDCARDCGRILVEAFHYRFHALMREMENVVAGGRLGRIEKAHAVFEATSPYSPKELRWNPVLGGGSLMDTGCYTIHALRTLIGREPEVLSTACEWRHGVDVNTRAQLDFGDGLVADIACSLDTPRQLYSELSLVGDRGSLYVEGFPLPQFGCKWRLETDRGVETMPPAGPATYDAQLGHVADIFLRGAGPLTGGRDAIANMRVIDGIFAAAGRQ